MRAQRAAARADERDPPVRGRLALLASARASSPPATRHRPVPSPADCLACGRPDCDHRRARPPQRRRRGRAAKSSRRSRWPSRTSTGAAASSLPGGERRPIRLAAYDDAGRRRSSRRRSAGWCDEDGALAVVGPATRETTSAGRRARRAARDPADRARCQRRRSDRHLALVVRAAPPGRCRADGDGDLPLGERRAAHRVAGAGHRPRRRHPYRARRGSTDASGLQIVGDEVYPHRR